MFFSFKTYNYYFGGRVTTSGKPLTPGSINYIMGNAGLMSAFNIARVLHRTEKSVRRFAEKQGISLKVLS